MSEATVAETKGLILPRGPVRITICSWCQSMVRIQPEPDLPKTEFTHGICPVCFARWKSDAGEGVAA